MACGRSFPCGLRFVSGNGPVGVEVRVCKIRLRACVRVCADRRITQPRGRRKDDRRSWSIVRLVMTSPAPRLVQVVLPSSHAVRSWCRHRSATVDNSRTYRRVLPPLLGRRVQRRPPSLMFDRVMTHHIVITRSERSLLLVTADHCQRSPHPDSLTTNAPPRRCRNRCGTHLLHARSD